VSVRWSLKFRPKKFGEVIGQAHVVEFFKVVLSNFFENSIPLPVGVLFGGHSGIGKTTIARVVAASLNCKSRKGVDPCGECDTCREIIGGVGGVLEIDSSFFGKVEDIRNLRDRLISYSFVTYQVVILDECQMMSREALSAFLKVLEEPPERVLFIFVTTKPEEGRLRTIKSRLLEFRFRLIEWRFVLDFLHSLLAREGAQCEDSLLYQLYQMVNQNLRELIVSLEQLAILGKGHISLDLVEKVYGDPLIYQKIFEALGVCDYDKAVSLYEEYHLFRSDFKFFLNGFLDFLVEKLRTSFDKNRDEFSLSTKIFRCICTFLSSKMPIEGLSGAKFLFFRIVDSLKGFQE